MQLRRIVIPNRLGLHARAAAKLVRLANTFRSSIQVSRCDLPARTADAKNILGLLLLAAKQHTEVEMMTEGEDETAAMEALSRLIEEKFGEKE
jgi:phosphocarrier protein HPr